MSRCSSWLNFFKTLAIRKGNTNPMHILCSLCIFEVYFSNDHNYEQLSTKMTKSICTNLVSGPCAYKVVMCTNCI